MFDVACVMIALLSVPAHRARRAVLKFHGFSCLIPSATLPDVPARRARRGALAVPMPELFQQKARTGVQSTYRRSNKGNQPRA